LAPCVKDRRQSASAPSASPARSRASARSSGTPPAPGPRAVVVGCAAWRWLLRRSCLVPSVAPSGIGPQIASAQRARAA